LSIKWIENNEVSGLSLNEGGRKLIKQASLLTNGEIMKENYNNVASVHLPPNRPIVNYFYNTNMLTSKFYKF